MINARDFYVLGDDSGALVTEWLTGGAKPLPDPVATIEELRTVTGIADLANTDTIDWAAITWASRVAQERGVYLHAGGRYRISRPLVFERGGLVGESVSAGSPGYTVRITRKAGLSASFDTIRLEPAASNRHFIFQNLVIQGGLRCIYATDIGGAGRSIEQHSVFENLILQGSAQEGLFFDQLQAIGCHFRRIKAENCGTHGIRFKGRAVLNGSQIESCRAVANKGHGFWLENDHAQAATAGVTVIGTIAEYNLGCGMLLQGIQGTLVSPYFEANNNDQLGDEPDLRLASSVSGSPTFHSNITAIGAAFSNLRNPGGHRISGTGPHKQNLLLLAPALYGGTVKDDNLALTMLPPGAATVV